MMKKTIAILITMFFLAVLLAACGGSADLPPSLTNIRLAKDEDGEKLTNSFEPRDTVYVLADLSNGTSETTLMGRFTAVDVGQYAAPNTVLDEMTLTTGLPDITFSLTPDSALPPGEYKVEIFLNEIPIQTLQYAIVEPQAAAPALSSDSGGSESESSKSSEPLKAIEAEPETTADKDVAESGQFANIGPGNGDDDAAADTTTSEGSALTGIDRIKPAVIRITSQGSFESLEGTVLSRGGGTGFIISEDGIAVTNNHVVTGAALIQVDIEGEDNPRNAKVLGVSECSDLAVIDIDGDGFSYLEWVDSIPPVGTDMYLAGFPLLTDEYTLTRGIVSKEKAGGLTPWSSVEHVIEYDATSNGGNSGGPAVNEDGKVIAVHYAGFGAARQAFGIGADVAQTVVEILRTGQDVDSIGINGEAFLGENFSGIWVSSVKSGSVADKAGIQGGDILTKMEGLVLATDGSMGDYCNILRSRDADAVIDVEILRLETGQLLEGQINGRELELVAEYTEPTYENYANITDDSGLLNIAVPSVWTQINGSPWLNGANEEVGLQVSASYDLDAFFNSWGTPGVVFKATPNDSYSVTGYLDSFDMSAACQYGGRELYSDQLYEGQYDRWVGCGETGATYILLVALSKDQSHLVQVEMTVLSSADEEAFEAVLESFYVDLSDS